MMANGVHVVTSSGTPSACVFAIAACRHDGIANTRNILFPLLDSHSTCFSRMNFAAFIGLCVACLGCASVLGMPVGVTVLQPAAGKSYITTRNSTTYNFQKEDYCFAGYCGKTVHPLNGCPWYGLFC